MLITHLHNYFPLTLNHGWEDFFISFLPYPVEPVSLSSAFPGSQINTVVLKVWSASAPQWSATAKSKLLRHF